VILPFENFEEWEYGSVGIANPFKSTLKRYFELFLETKKISGDIAEFGVSKGNSLITSALISRNLGTEKVVYGFDTFSGFPKYSLNDEFGIFHELKADNEISDEHYKKILKNMKYIEIREGKISPGTISNSGDFSNTGLELVKKKVNFFGLSDNVRIIQGDFTENFKFDFTEKKLSLVLMDCDLFEGYASILPIVWKNLSPGGYIYLDEYYSLKFPGPRLAVNKFVRDSGCNLVELEPWLDFERWAIKKNF
jgi:hypothetical protein